MHIYTCGGDQYSLPHVRTLIQGRTRALSTRRLTVTLEAELLATLPVGTHRWTTLVGAMVLGAKTAVSFASGGESTELTVLVDRSADPVDARVTTDSLVGWVDHDDLEVLEGGILVNPVRVEDTEVSTLPGSTLLSDATQRPAGLQVVDTSIARLAINLTLVHRTLAASTTDAHTIDAEALLGLVSEATSLVRTGRAGGAVHCRHLTKLPGANTLEESHDIRLLTVPQLPKVLVCSHVLKVT